MEKSGKGRAPTAVAQSSQQNKIIVVTKQQRHYQERSDSKKRKMLPSSHDSHDDEEENSSLKNQMQLGAGPNQTKTSGVVDMPSNKPMSSQYSKESGDNNNPRRHQSCDASTAAARNSDNISIPLPRPRSTTTHPIQSSVENNNDPYNLYSRLVMTQKRMFAKALMEIRQGQKRTCWLWFILPTAPYVVNGIEKGSQRNRRFALRGGDDAVRAYLEYPTQTFPVVAEDDQNNASNTTQLQVVN